MRHTASRATHVRVGVIVVCAFMCMSACGTGPETPRVSADEPTDGTGFLVAADLQPVTPLHFTAAPRPMSASLALRDNGCVTVTIAGTQHTPIWPDGTRVADSAANPGTYTVTLSNGTTLEVNADGGTAFKASGVVDDVRGPFNDAEGVPGKVQQLLDFCGAPGEPVLFTDATTFARG